ncbi:MAG TPA: FG-GAP-like repeat-containing protein [Bryobacteraceae bacterium]|nr:FG-GAP-like repeat-containing protein [Bryobacteraceae bacterium]
MVRRFFHWATGLTLLCVSLWVVAIGQAPSITVPFATAPLLATTNTSVSVFFHRLNGSYVNAAYSYSSGFPVASGTSAIAGLISDGLSNLLAAPAGPANVGRAVQMVSGGKFTSSGTIGAAYTTFNSDDNAVHVAIGSASLVYTGTATYTVGPGPNGVIAADFNGDGVLDLVVPYLGMGNGSPGGIAVLINKGDGTFQSPVIYTAGSAPDSVATLDLNQDGIPDLAVADGGSSSVYVLLGNGNGTFKPAVAYPTSSNGLSITIADLNGDGAPDLAESEDNGKISILFNNGSGSFSAGPTIATPSSAPNYIAAGDLRGTGHNDLVTADLYSSTITVYLNAGDGNFTLGSSYATSYSPNSLIITDYNGDGKLDILNATGDARAFGPSMESGNVDLFLGNGDGTFQGVSVTPISGSPLNSFLAVADFNGDGVPDAVANGAQSVLLFPGTRAGTFQAPTSIPTGTNLPAGAAAGDFNGDGRPDLAITDNSSDSVVVLLNSASGFQSPSSFSSGGDGASGIVAADFNGDGKLDLAVTNNTSATTAVFLGGGNGTFQLAATYPTGVAPLQITAADVNGDGKPDLIVLDSGNFSVSNGAIYVLINNGTGGFNSPVSYTPSEYPLAVSVGDVNGDGKPDLLAAVQDAQSNYYLAVLLNTGNGTFGPATLMSSEFGPSSIAIADFNGDGKGDLVVAHCCGATNMTYQQGNGDGTFSAEVDFNGGSSPDLVQVTSFNGGAAPDLAIFLGGSGSPSGMAGILNNAAASHPLTNLSAAGGVAALAPGALASAYGTGLATGAAGATATPLPLQLNGTRVSIMDAAGNTTAAPLVYVSATQVNYLIPATVATGPATVTITSGNGTKSSGNINLTSVAPGVFTLNTANLAAADALCISASGAQTLENVYQVVNGAITAAPINLGTCSETVLVLYGTGFDTVSASGAQVTLGGKPGQVSYSGPQGSFVGLDQVNVVIPASLAGSGNIPVILTAGGQTANTVNLTIQ